MRLKIKLNFVKGRNTVRNDLKTEKIPINKSQNNADEQGCRKALDNTLKRQKTHLADHVIFRWKKIIRKLKKVI